MDMKKVVEDYLKDKVLLEKVDEDLYFSNLNNSPIFLNKSAKTEVQRIMKEYVEKPIQSPTRKPYIPNHRKRKK